MLAGSAIKSRNVGSRDTAANRRRERNIQRDGAGVGRERMRERQNEASTQTIDRAMAVG